MCSKTGMSFTVIRAFFSSLRCQTNVSFCKFPTHLFFACVFLLKHLQSFNSLQNSFSLTCNKKKVTDKSIGGKNDKKDDCDVYF